MFDWVIVLCISDHDVACVCDKVEFVVGSCCALSSTPCISRGMWISLCGGVRLLFLWFWSKWLIVFRYIRSNHLRTFSIVLVITSKMDIRQLIAKNRELLITSLSPSSTDFLWYLLEKQLIEYYEVKKHKELDTIIRKTDDLIKYVQMYRCVGRCKNVDVYRCLNIEAVEAI